MHSKYPIKQNKNVMFKNGFQHSTGSITKDTHDEYSHLGVRGIWFKAVSLDVDVWDILSSLVS